jgi:hypothetical protein
LSLIEKFRSGGNSIENIVLLLEKAFIATKENDISEKTVDDTEKLDKTKKDDSVSGLDKSKDEEGNKKSSFSYVLSKFTNQYGKTAGINPYTPQASYNYSLEESNNQFVPVLQTYYIPERKKHSKDGAKANNNFQVIAYNDVKEIQRVAKMNVMSSNNYTNPDLELEYKYWSMFSFNFVISGLVYNHIGS